MPRQHHARVYVLLHIFEVVWLKSGGGEPLTLDKMAEVPAADILSRHPSVGGLEEPQEDGRLKVVQPPRVQRNLIHECNEEETQVFEDIGVRACFPRHTEGDEAC